MHTNLTIILNTHMPNVLGRGPLFREPENWLFEAITETYIPLLRTLSSWDAKKHSGKKIVFSLTPCLVDQLVNGKDRYIDYLETMQKIAAFEVERTAHPKLYYRYNKSKEVLSDQQLSSLKNSATHYLKRINDALEFVKNNDFVSCIRNLNRQAPESIELWTSTPDHNFLPFFENSTQKHLINKGVALFEETFQQSPDGFWLPECAFFPETEKHLVNAGVKQTALTPHAIGVYHPEIKSGFYQRDNLKLLIHDHRLAVHIWKAPQDTIPSNPVYREFYRDLGMDVTSDYFQDLGITLSEEQKINGVWTGIKYYACANRDVDLSDKPIYEADVAFEQAKRDSKTFVNIMNTLRHNVYDRKSFIMAFDTEILGHWWHEGVHWLEHLLQQDLEGIQ